MLSAPNRCPAMPVTPGQISPFRVELPDTMRRVAGKGRPSAVHHALGAVVVPPGFDPQKPWPVLVVSATADPRYNSSRKLLQLFAPPALAAGWVVVAADPDPAVDPEGDTIELRFALVRAALAALQIEWPGLADWPVAFGGFSGGAKFSGWLAGLSALNGRLPVGIYLAGCNEPTPVDAADIKGVPRWKFVRVPVFLSSGDKDPIATPDQHRRVLIALRGIGFQTVRMESHPGRHEIYQPHLQQALEWFAAESARK
jgi:hypothetical protein